LANRCQRYLTITSGSWLVWLAVGAMFYTVHILWFTVSVLCECADAVFCIMPDMLHLLVTVVKQVTACHIRPP